MLKNCDAKKTKKKLSSASASWQLTDKKKYWPQPHAKNLGIHFNFQMHHTTQKEHFNFQENKSDIPLLNLDQCGQIQKIGWESLLIRENVYILQKQELHPLDGVITFKSLAQEQQHIF